MNVEIILLLGTLIIMVGLGIVFLIRRGRPLANKEIDYRALFNMGIIFFPVGLTISIATHIINPLFILGLIFFIMGLANKNKWKPNQ